MCHPSLSTEAAPKGHDLRWGLEVPAQPGSALTGCKPALQPGVGCSASVACHRSLGSTCPPVPSACWGGCAGIADGLEKEVGMYVCLSFKCQELEAASFSPADSTSPRCLKKVQKLKDSPEQPCGVALPFLWVPMTQCT